MTNPGGRAAGGFQEKGLVVLRWIFFLPLAAAVAWAAWGIVNGLNHVTLMLSGVNPDWFIGRAFKEFSAGAAMGAAFVFVGTRVAPARKPEVVFILAGIAILTSGVALYPSIATGAGWAILSGVSVALGAGLVAWSVYTGETDPGSI